MNMSMMESLAMRALDHGIPLRVQLDLTYRCNEACVHCYLDHEDHGEMDTAEVLRVLDQLAEAGTFFLTISGGEIFMRKDLFQILDHAHKLRFSMQLKTNAVMIKPEHAQRLAWYGLDSVAISLYSHIPETHDAITKVKGSFKRTVNGARYLIEHGVKTRFTCVLMSHNADDYMGVKTLAEEIGAQFSMDTTITPMMDGDRGILDLNISGEQLAAVFHDQRVLGDTGTLQDITSGEKDVVAEAYESLPCSAGHTAAYISPYGEVYPCVQFPYLTGNVREKSFEEIWKHSPQFAEVRAIRVSTLEGCSKCVHSSSCSRCPGLAYLEGNMRGPSIQDCEKSYARTGVPSWNLQKAWEKDAAKKIRTIPIAIL